MKLFNSKTVAFLLVFLLVFHIGTTGILGSQEVKAGFWDDNKGNIMTVIKGLVMLWIINLMRTNIGGNDNEDLITSTIKKGLDIGMSSTGNNDNPVSNNVGNNSVDNADNYPVNSKDSIENNNSAQPDLDIINYKYVTDEEYQMLKDINEVRREKGLDLLELDMELTKAAREMAVNMINSNNVDQNYPSLGSPTEMLKKKNIKYSIVGENLMEASSIEEAFQLLMNKSDYHDNIVKAQYDRVGNGVVRKDDGNYLIVQLFIGNSNPLG